MKSTDPVDGVPMVPSETIMMPKPTAWPMAAAAGVALIATGIATSLLISVAGLSILLIAIGGWVAQLAPGQGEIQEALLPVAQRAGKLPSPGVGSRSRDQVCPFIAAIIRSVSTLIPLEPWEDSSPVA